LSHLDGNSGRGASIDYMTVSVTNQQMTTSGSLAGSPPENVDDAGPCRIVKVCKPHDMGISIPCKKFLYRLSGLRQHQSGNLSCFIDSDQNLLLIESL